MKTYMTPQALELYLRYKRTPPPRHGSTLRTDYWRGRDFPERRGLRPPRDSVAHGAWLAGMHAAGGLANFF